MPVATEPTKAHEQEAMEFLRAIKAGQEATALEVKEMAGRIKKAEELQALAQKGAEEAKAELASMKQQMTLIAGDAKSRDVSAATAGLKHGVGKGEFSIARALNAIARKDPTLAPTEWEAMKAAKDAAKQKGMIAGTASQGGFLIPAQVVAEVLPYLRAATAVDKAGARYVFPTGMPYSVRKKTGSSTAYWIGEGVRIQKSKLAVGMIDMTPKMVATLVPASRRLIEMADASAEQLIMQDMGETLGLAIDIAALRSDGTAQGGNPAAAATGPTGSPRGISKLIAEATITAAGVAAANGVDQPLEAILQMKKAIKRVNALTGPLSFISHSDVTANLLKQKIFQFSGQTDQGGPGYFFPPEIMFGNPDVVARAAGMKGIFDQTMIPTNLTKGTSNDCAEGYLGVFAEMFVALFGNIMIEATTEGGDSFEQHEMWFKAVADADVALAQEGSFQWYGGFRSST